MVTKIKVLVLSCFLLMVLFIGFGCEIPGTGSSNNDTTATVGTGGTYNTTGTGTGGTGSATNGAVSGTWKGTYTDSWTNSQFRTLESGLLVITINQSGAVISGTGYTQENGTQTQDAFTFSNGAVNGTNVSFTLSESVTDFDPSTGIQYTGNGTNKIIGVLSGNVMSGTYEQTVTITGSNGASYTESSRGNFSVSR